MHWYLGPAILGGGAKTTPDIVPRAIHLVIKLRTLHMQIMYPWLLNHLPASIFFKQLKYFSSPFLPLLLLLQWLGVAHALLWGWHTWLWCLYTRVYIPGYSAHTSLVAVLAHTVLCDGDFSLCYASVSENRPQASLWVLLGSNSWSLAYKESIFNHWIIW